MSVEGPAGRLTGRAVQRRRLALLAILAAGQVRGRGASREKLVAYLWPEADPERGRPLLSDSVYRINQAVGGEAIVAVGDELRLNHAVASSDVADFERAIESGDRERAAALYAGTLLDGVYLVDGTEFERWLDGERARLSRAYEEVLDALAQAAESNGAAGDAAAWWRQLAAHDPYSSRVALRLMQALAAVGDSAAAVRHAATHATLLQEELGVAPNAAVRRLAERLKSEPVEPAIETTTPREPAPAAHAEIAVSAAAAPLPNVDRPSTPSTPWRVAADPRPRRAPSTVGVAIGLVAILVALGLIAWQTPQRASSAPAASIAVLPFTDLSQGHDNAYFSDAITEDLINTLAQVQGVRVAARTSVFAYRDARADVRDVARKLGVATVLEGSVRKSGGKIRITAQLANAADGFQLWSQSYDREPDDALAIQEDISRAIVTVLRGSLSRERPRPRLIARLLSRSRDPTMLIASTTFRTLARAASALVIAAGSTAVTAGAQAGSTQPIDGEWRAYGRDALGSRWSPLAELTRENVSRLERAWTYHTGETAAEFAGKRRQRSLEVTPLVADGRMFISTPLGRVMALDPETGRELWKFDPKVDRDITFGDFTSRGVSYWVDRRQAGQRATAACVRRVVIATIDGRLIALDAERGTPCAAFGTGGTVDLRATLRNKPEESSEYEVTSPPAIVNDIIVVGSAVADNSRFDAASGEVRAFDARTGTLRWTWDPIPQDSTDAAWRTWTGPRAHSTGAANAWSVIAADAARDLVFVPTGSASPDYFGGERLGDNRYANSIVALRASTGRVAWHFQVVHHDLWDYDVASPPALVTLRKDGKEIPVVLQSTKTGQLFVLNRDTGVPVFPVEERPVPASDVPGERASATQPFNVVLPPLSPQRLTPDEAFGRDATDRAACRARIEGLRNEGPFTPPSERGTLVYPSSIGGAHWGGVTYDPVRQLVVAPVNRIPIEVKLIPRASFDRTKTTDAAETRGPGAQYTNMRGTPYVMRRQFMFGPAGAPCSPPPFGSLVAIDLNTGTKKWDVPLGTLGAMLPAGVDSAQAAALGSVNLGGAISTAGGLVFVAAALDRALHAYDIETGRELWKGELPAGGKATPMTFRGPRDGRQYVVIAGGGDGEMWGWSDAVVAFRLMR